MRKQSFLDSIPRSLLRGMLYKWMNDMETESLNSLRKEAVCALQKQLETNPSAEELCDTLWACIRLYQNEPFVTSGRGKRPGVEFFYCLKRSKITGEETGELLVNRKERSKTLTKSSVSIGLSNALEVQREEGCVKGPKRLKVFGASYLYAIFLRFGIIRNC